MGVFVVILSGDLSSTTQFHNKVKTLPWNNVVWLKNDRSAFPAASLFVMFGSNWEVPKLTPFITWSGNDEETIERVYKTLRLV